MPTAIVTIPPYAPFIKEVARHPIVSGLRLNTVMPVKESLEKLLERLQEDARGKKFWIDLKGRQLRTTTYAVPPYTEVRISHNITVQTPVKAYFGDRTNTATIAAVDGDRLLFLDGPKRVVGPGESVNIIDPSLEITGYLTGTDKEYIAAARAAGLHDYMLSFVEGQQDIDDVRLLDPDANIVAKIESVKGIGYVKNKYKKDCSLMAARGDLFLELEWPHHILEALDTILYADKNAIAASRIFASLAHSPEPSCEDITDAAYLLRSGYKTLMLGDEVCLQRDSVISALNLYAEVNATLKKPSE